MALRGRGDPLGRFRRVALVSCRRSPRRLPTPPGGRPLEPDVPASNPARPDDTPPAPRDDAPPARPGDAPPAGLRAQVAATKDALLAFARAHLALARAEADEIKGEVGRAAALGGLALGVAILLALFLPIGGMLFLGDWLFGSIGWGVLLGTELLIAVAVTAIVVALRVPRLGFQVLVALLIGLAIGLVFGLSLTYRLFSAIGEALAIPTEPGYAAAIAGLVVGAVLGVLISFTGWRSAWSAGGGGRAAGMLLIAAIAGAAVGALVGGGVGLLIGVFIAGDVRARATAIVVVAAIGALGGLIGGFRAGRSGSAAIYGLAAGTAAGIVVGAILGVDYGPRIGAAAGFATFLLAWPALMLLRLKQAGIDGDALKQRFWPQETIDTTKESIEWAKARLPRGPRS